MFTSLALRRMLLLTLGPLLAFAGDAPGSAAESPYSGHGVQSVSPAQLASFAPTALDPAVQRRIQSMLDIRAPGMGIVSPDGKRLFFTWSITGTAQVWRLDGPRSFPRQMTGGADTTAISTISPDGKFLLLSRDRAGEENPGLYIQSVEGGPLRVIQHKKDVQTFFQYISPDSRVVYYKANDQDRSSYAIYGYDVATGESQALFTQPGLWNIDDVTQGRFLLGKATGSMSREYFDWEPKRGTLTPLLGQGEKEEYIAQFGRDPNDLLVLTNKFGDFRRLYRWRFGKFTPITPEMKMDVSDISIDEARQHILYQVNDGGYNRLGGLDAGSFKPLTLPSFPDADHTYTGTTSRDGRYTTIGVETARAPRSSYVYDWYSRALTQWVVPSAPEVDTSRFVRAELEYYPARDGTPIPMFVRRPPQCRDRVCPVIVDFHGGPEGQSVPGFSVYAQIFIEAGFVYVEPNVRGSEGYGKTWLEADNGARRLDVVTDIEACATFIKSKWTKSGKTPRVGILGGSYGGYSALMGMTYFAGSYDVGVAIVSISNLHTFLINTAPYRRALRITEYGDPDKDKEVLLKLSPITYVERVKGPLLLIQGATDPRTPVGEAIQIHEALNARKIPSKLIIFAEEGHGFRSRANQVLSIGHTLQFFQEHLKQD